MGKYSLSLAEIEKQISLVDGSKTQAALDNRKNNPKLTVLNPVTENITNKAELPALDSERPKRSFSDWLKGSNTLEQMQNNAESKKKNALQKQTQNAQKSELTADLQKWSSPDYKMTDEDKAKFKEYQQKIDLGGTYGYSYADLQGQQLEDFIAVGNKVNKLANFAYGLTDNPLGKLVANTYSKFGADADGNEVDELKEARSNAYTQDILTTGAGALTGQMANYSIGSKVAQSIPVLQKASGAIGQGVEKFTKSAKLGKSAQNVFGDMMLDVALDTVPTTLENVQSGMGDGDVAKETAKNLGLNLAFNVGGEAVSNALPTLKKFINNRSAAVDKPKDLKAASENIVKQIKEYANGAMENGRYIDLGKTPEYLNDLGSTDNPFMMKQSTVYKTAYPEGYLTGKHNLGYEPFKQIPYQLDDPVAVMKSTTQPNSAVVVTDMIDENGYPVIMPIHMDKNGKWGVTNELASLYGKRNIDKMIENAEKSGNIISINKERANAIASKHGLQLPDMKSNADPIFSNSISNSQNNVNTSPKTMAEDIGIPMDEVLEGPEMGMSKYSSDTVINKTDLPDSVKNEFVDNPQMYEVVKNADTIKETDEFMASHAIDESYAEFTKRLERKDPTSITMGYRLAKMYGESGNAAMAVEIVESMSSQLTKAGQFTQAAAIDLLKENPMAAMRFMEKQINKLNQTGAEKFGKKWTDFKMTDDEVKAFADIEPNDTEAIKGLYDNISKRIAKDYPATMWEKVVEATKTAMMLNPRTHLRNAVANAIMSPVRSLSDRVSALGQNAARLFDSNVNVTQSLVGGSKAQKKIADEIFDESIAPLLKKNDKWEEASSNIMRNKQVFKDSKLGKLSKSVSIATLNGVNKLSGGRLEKLVEMANESMTGSIMENLRKFDYWLLGDVEDDIFVKKNFSNRLASYMRAQGIKSIDDVPAEAIGIAYDEALKATFKDDNNITRAFSGIKKSTGKFGEVLLPFTKTPANIAARGIDYSPAGFINAIKQAKDGGTVADIIDTVSKASLGTGAIFAGYLLAKEGMIQGALSSDKDQQQFEKQQGKQAFSINVNGNYYTYDWAQPAAIPIIIGSAIYDGIKESDGEVENLLNIGWQATKAGVDAWAGLSPISSLQDILGGGTYSSESVAENVLNEVIEFPQRLYPAAFTATAKTIDPTYRQTYTKGDVLQTQIDTLKSKIPVLSKDLPVSYDTWGNERKRQDSTGSAAFANFLNPGTLGYDASTPIDGEINRLFEATQSKSVFPNKAEWSVKDRYGNTIDLTSQQYSDYQKSMGQTSYRLADAFIGSDIYADMSDEDRASTLSDIYSAVKSMTKNKMFGSSVSAENQKIIDAYNAGGANGVVDYIHDKHILNSYGLKSSDESSLEFIDEYGIDAFVEASDTLQTFGLKQNKANRELYLTGGLPVLAHAQLADANGDGSITKNAELIPYLKQQDWSPEDKNWLVEQFGFSTKNLKW